MSDIHAVTMPRWGLTMEEGLVTQWMVAIGETVAPGQEIVEVESTKLAGVVEAAEGGVLRRQVVPVGQTVPTGTLIGVLAGADVSEEAIDAFVGAFVIPDFDAEGGEGSGEQSIDVKGAKIAYLRAGTGSGDPILLVHGFGGDATSWAMVMDGLSTDHDVIALDLPGHGGSAKQVAGGGLADLGAFLADFLDALDLPRVHLVGHSMGGGACIALAAQAPDRVASMTLLAPMGLGREINADYLAAFTAARKSRDVKDALRSLFADESLLSRSLVDEVLKYKRLDGVDAALAVFGAALLDGDGQRAVYDAIGAPDGKVALLAGAEDRIIPPAQVESRGGRLLLGVGHMPQVEAAADVVAAIRDTIG